MATPRLGLVVEDKPTELSCTQSCTCIAGCGASRPKSKLLHSIHQHSLTVSGAPQSQLDLMRLHDDNYNIICTSHKYSNIANILP